MKVSRPGSLAAFLQSLGGHEVSVDQTWPGGGCFNPLYSGISLHNSSDVNSVGLQYVVVAASCAAQLLVRFCRPWLLQSCILVARHPGLGNFKKPSGMSRCRFRLRCVGGCHTRLLRAKGESAVDASTSGTAQGASSPGSPNSAAVATKSTSCYPASIMIVYPVASSTPAISLKHPLGNSNKLAVSVNAPISNSTHCFVDDH